MSQSKLASKIEVGCGTLIAMITAVITQMIVFPIFDMEVTFGQNIKIMLIFTVVSVIRGYYWRRFMNMLHVKGVLK
jgi:hypothetical protein